MTGSKSRAERAGQMHLSIALMSPEHVSPRIMMLICSISHFLDGAPSGFDAQDMIFEIPSDSL